MLRTLEIDFPRPAHFDVLARIRQVGSTKAANVLALEQGGIVVPVEKKVWGLERFNPDIARVSGVRIELNAIAQGADIEYSPRNKRNPDFPPCITRLREPGDNYPILVGDPTGNRMVVAKAFVCVKQPNFFELIKISLGSFFNTYVTSRI